MNVTVADFRQSLVAVGRVGWRNLVGLVVVTLTVWLTMVPLLAVLVVGTPIAILGGLWTTCLLLGIALVVVFRFTSRAVERGVGVALWPSFRAAADQIRVGLALGATTFGILVVSLAVVGVSPDPYWGTAVGISGFLLVFWYLLVGLASPELAVGSSLGTAIRAGGLRFVSSPILAVWFLFLSVLASLVAGATLITLLVFLPGVLGLLAMQIATDIATVEEVSTLPVAQRDEDSS